MKLTEKETEILEILDENSRVDAETIAKMANIPAEEVKSIIEKLEKEKVIIDYAAMIDWRKVDGLEGVTAMIDVKVTPKRNVGFDEVAERIYRFQEVESVYLMSGVYDLSVVIRGNTMSDVASFVSEKLSTLESVVSTTTHFILKNISMTAKSLKAETMTKESWCLRKWKRRLLIYLTTCGRLNRQASASSLIWPLRWKASFHWEWESLTL